MKKKQAYKYKSKQIHGCTISYGNAKVGGMMNESFDQRSCPIDCPCRNVCYVEGEKGFANRYKSALDAYKRNLDVYLSNPDEYFKSVRRMFEIARDLKTGVRMMVDGDSPDVNHFKGVIDIAREFPTVPVIWMTKAYAIVNTYCDTYTRESIPESVTVRFSAWKGYPMPNPYGFPVSEVILEGSEAPEGYVLCLNQAAKRHGKKWQCRNCMEHKCGCFNRDITIAFLKE